MRLIEKETCGVDCGVQIQDWRMTLAKAVRARFAIVEDEPFMAQLVSDMLVSSGAEVEIFELGAALLKSADLLKFKAIILDLSLPDIDGFELMENLAANTIGMSIVLMSGHDPGTLRAARIYGNGLGLKMRGALAKPFTKYEMLAALGWPG